MEPVYGVHVARVTANDDPEELGRVRLVVPDVTARKEVWARVATLSAGPGRGTWFVPEVGDEVLVAFEGGDPQRPYVLGSLWNAAARPPETEPAKKVVREPGLELRDANGNLIALEPPGIRIQSVASLKVSASTLELTGSIVYVNSSFTRFSGTIQADTLIATSVVAQSYTPGAGNIW
jgi:phage baseplate assembly protein gpV